MKEKSWKCCVMVGCFGLLVVVMGTIFLRLGTEQVLIKKLHQDNAFTQAVFADNENLRTRGGMKNKPLEDKKVDWAKQYPFAIHEEKSMQTNLMDKSQILEKRIQNGAKKKIDDWTTIHLWNYRRLVEMGRRYEKLIGWSVINPAQKVTSFPDSYLTFAYPRQNQQERVESTVHLAEFAESQGAEFLFVQAPFKVDAYGDSSINGVWDFSNQNADELLTGLQSQGIEVLDLRETLHELAPLSEDYHKFFYRTDHHWRPQAALLATDKMAAKLEDMTNMHFARENYAPERYRVETYPSWFLGSQGKKVTLAKTEPDDFDVVVPAFPTHLQVEMPSLGIDRVGDFSLLLEARRIEKKDYYNLNPYGYYSYGDLPLTRIENFNQPDDGSKILLISDSFSDALMPYLAMGCRNLVKLDLRYFTGSVETFIQQEKPTVVLVMYNPSVYADKIVWQGHEDLFDFR